MFSNLRRLTAMSSVALVLGASPMLARAQQPLAPQQQSLHDIYK